MSFACWELQRELLLEASPEATAYDVSFLGIYHSDQHNHMETCRDTIAGRGMSQRWDVSSEAGRAGRPQAAFQEEPPSLEVLTLADGEVKSLGLMLYDSNLWLG